MAIKPEYLTLDSLLQKRLFRIPQYQRTYSWETQQRADLFGDLEKLARQENDRHHFMSTLVCLKTVEHVEIGTDEYEVLDVVDGQQRLTTLIILLKAISLSMANGTSVEQVEAGKLDNLLAKRDLSLILLQTNHQSSMMFTAYLLDGIVPDGTALETLAEQNLYDAFIECQSFVEEWQSHADLMALLKLIKNRLDFIFYVLEDEGSVYTVFEVLNSRGLVVDSLDKCKSMLMGIVFQRLQRDLARERMNELQKCWESLYSTLGVRAVPGSEVLRFSATLWHPTQISKPLSDREALDTIRTFCEEDPARTVEVSRRLLTVAKALERLYSDPRRRAVTAISHARLLAVAILSSNYLSDPDRKQVLAQWEKVTFRIYGLFRKDSRTAVGDYTRLARAVISGHPPKADILERIIAIGAKYPIDEAVHQTRGADCYNEWEDELRYFLYRYEEFLVAQEGGQMAEQEWSKIWHGTASTTIEHILPQTPSDAWQGKVKNFEKHVHRLGNLVVLPPKLNKKAGAKGFKEKRKLYEGSRLRILDEVKLQPDWNRNSIDRREEALLQWAMTEWGD